MKHDYRRVLEAADEPGCYEFPSKFDYDALEARAKQIQTRVLQELREPTTFEGANFNQDASFSIDIILTSHVVLKDKLRYQPSIRFSNFGNLVTICWHDLMPHLLYQQIIKIVEDDGFHFIPEEELATPYDGVMTGKFPNWWGRYFDWI